MRTSASAFSLKATGFPFMLLALAAVWFGVIIALNLQTSFLTPPFGFALFYLRGVAPPEIKTSDIYRGVLPFIALQVIALIALISFPGLILRP